VLRCMRRQVRWGGDVAAASRLQLSSLISIFSFAFPFFFLFWCVVGCTPGHADGTTAVRCDRDGRTQTEHHVKRKKSCTTSPGVGRRLQHVYYFGLAASVCGLALPRLMRREALMMNIRIGEQPELSLIDRTVTSLPFIPSFFFGFQRCSCVPTLQRWRLLLHPAGSRALTSRGGGCRRTMRAALRRRGRRRTRVYCVVPSPPSRQPPRLQRLRQP
jgi:hypothetical protein